MSIAHSSMHPSAQSTDLLRVSDRPAAAIEQLLGRASELCAEFETGLRADWCAGRQVAFIWDGEGFRNRAAFELGVRAAGGVGVEIPGRLGEREGVADLARYLDNWFDAIVVRTPSFAALQALAEHAQTPVVNARTGENHPCEILGDLAFVRHLRGALGPLKVVFVGEATNLCHSWCEAAAVLEIEVVQVCPEGFEVDPRWLAALSPELPSRVSVGRSVQEAVVDADIVYTDCWPTPGGPSDRVTVADRFLPFQVTTDVLARAPSHALFLPCPPVTRGEEVSSQAMEDPRCRVVEAKAWLLHAQNALLEDILRTE